MSPRRKPTPQSSLSFQTKKYTGDPYVKDHSFYVFDDFDFKRGFKIFDNHHSLHNIKNFVANDTVPSFYRAKHLSNSDLAEYLVMEERRHNAPVFVDHPDLDLNVSESLDVVLAHLMRDFDKVSKTSNFSSQMMMTKKNIENMQAYLSEHQEDEVAMAAMIEMVNAGRLLAIKNKNVESSDTQEADTQGVDSQGVDSQKTVTTTAATKIKSDKVTLEPSTPPLEEVQKTPETIWYDDNGPVKKST